VYGLDHEDKVVALAVPDGSSDTATRSVSAGNIVKIWGLKHVQIGDRVGRRGSDEFQQQFPPPTMESFVRARSPSDGARLRVALDELAEQDPLINVQQDQEFGELSVSLYGEVQKEIVESALVEDYGIQADFRETTIIYIERPIRNGEAIEFLTADANPYMATVGLRIEPGPAGSGLKFSVSLDQRSVPLYIYKSEGAFIEHMTRYVRGALGRGLYGWSVTDCAVVLSRCDYYIGDGPAKPTVPMARTTSADFRLLTPLVVSQALKRAGTRVCEPMLRLKVELPSATTGDVLSLISHLGGSVTDTRVHEVWSTIEARMPASRLRLFQKGLLDLSGGEGNVHSTFDGYQPVRGTPPRRVLRAEDRSS
jgi:ribosomal protection tetracycline resistance protein